MKVSIVTPVLNSQDTVEDCIKSILSQNYPEIEHIIIDGGSTDGTLEIMEKYKSKGIKVISEKDEGIYDAMNKGLKLSSGDIVGILNSDDVYSGPGVIRRIVEEMSSRNVDSCYGDIIYVDRDNSDKVVRFWKAGQFVKKRFRVGWMPPHPTFFVRKSVYEKYGGFDLRFPLAADYELMLRFLYKYSVSVSYIPEVLVKMRAGGTSRPGSYTLKAIAENYRAWKVNDLDYPVTVLLKPLSKVFQFIPFNKDFRENVG